MCTAAVRAACCRAAAARGYAAARSGCASVRHAGTTAFDLRTFAQPAVRDLAWVIAAPQVLSTSRIFPLWQGLGAGALERNLPLLASLDADPAPLHAFLRARHRTRLGDRFEALVLFALEHAALAGGARVLGLRASVAIHDKRAEGSAYLRQLRGAVAAVAPADGRTSAHGGGDGGHQPDSSDTAAAAALRRHDAVVASAFDWWRVRRAAGEARRAARRAASAARRRAAPSVTLGEFDFLFGEAMETDPNAPPVLRHVEVSVKYLLHSECLTAAKARGVVAAHIPPGCGVARCAHAGCSAGGAAAAACALGFPWRTGGVTAEPATALTSFAAAPSMPQPPQDCLAAWAAGLREYHGPHRLESLELKIRRGCGQMALGGHARAQAWLAEHAPALLQPPLRGGTTAPPAAKPTAAATAAHAPTMPPPAVTPISAAYMLAGYLFYPLAVFTWPAAAPPAGSPPPHCVHAPCVLPPAYLARLPPAIPREHLAGWFTDDVGALVARRASSRWVILPKPFWLGPLVVPCSAHDAAAMEAAWARGVEQPAAAAAAAAAAVARAGPAAAVNGRYLDEHDQLCTASEKATWLARQQAAPSPAQLAKYAGAGCGLNHWDGLGLNALPRVMDGRGLRAAVASNHAAAVSAASARALRLLVAEVQFAPGWGARGPACTAGGAWLEVSRGFVVEDGWALEGDEAHEAKYGREQLPVGA